MTTKYPECKNCRVGNREEHECSYCDQVKSLDAFTAVQLRRGDDAVSLPFNLLLSSTDLHFTCRNARTVNKRSTTVFQTSRTHSSKRRLGKKS
jgi:hypothetical protein